MRPRERRETGEQDLFRSRLDQIIDMNHALARLARTVDWEFLEDRFGEVYTDDPGHPPLPTRLMAGLAILKHTYDLSDEVLCERWVENPYYQYFCGEEFFQHRLVFDRSSLTRWRNRMGEERLQALMQESLSAATKTGAIKPSELSRVIVDTTVQPKNVTFPTDAKLMNRAREKLVRLAQLRGVALRQSYARVGKFALIQHQRYAHAKQFKRANRMLKKLRTYLGRVIRDIGRKIEGDSGHEAAFAQAAVAGAARARATAAPARTQGLFPARAGGRMHRQGQGPPALRVRRQGLRRHHHQACKGGQFVTHVKALPGNPYDGHTLATDPGHGGAGRQHHRARPRRQGISRPQCTARLQVQDLHLRPETGRDTPDQAPVAPPVCHRARHRPSQSRAPHGPQLSLVPSRRCQQRRPRRRRLQLPPPDPLAQAFVAPNPDRSPRRAVDQSSLKSGFFTDDSVSAGAHEYFRSWG